MFFLDFLQIKINFYFFLKRAPCGDFCSVPIVNCDDVFPSKVGLDLLDESGVDDE